MNIVGSSSERAYLTFNISGIPAGAEITFAQLLLTNSLAEASFAVDIHHVIEFNETWSNNTITSNNQICNFAFDDSTNCVFFHSTQ